MIRILVTSTKVLPTVSTETAARFRMSSSRSTKISLGYVLGVCCALLSPGCAVETSQLPAEHWEPTTLSDATIQKVQGAKHHYLQCITKAVKQERYQKLDTRVATDEILKSCETELTAIREAFLSEKVPPAIADRYLKRTRTQTARSVLENMMYAAASRSNAH